MNYDDVTPELREKAKACQSPDELLALARKEGYELSEDELAAVAGGGTDWFYECMIDDCDNFDHCPSWRDA